MSAVAIKAEGLSKRYRIGERGTYRTLRETFGQSLPGGRRAREGTGGAGELDHIWALKDLSFEVAEGEVVGVIGRNGAGKSTLLRILSRITEPTEGWASIRGRLGSLLEVGTGFHPELTGRENIYLNGAILGMRRAEMSRKFDEIVSFAEVERFIDTPVKRYSSGMYVRLAFAVAAHLEPEILVVDEVLAVGDAAFQKKCLGTMGHAAREGRTVLFVSHNMTAIKALCARALLLDEGQLKEDGPAARVVNRYLSSGRVSRAESVWREPARAPGTEAFRLHAVRLRGPDGDVTSELTTEDEFEVEVEHWNLVEGARLGATVVVFNEESVCVFSSMSNREEAWHGRSRPEGLFRSTCRVPGNLLADGYFTVSVLLWGENYATSHREDEVVEFEVHDVGTGRGDYLGGWSGVVRPQLDWTTERVEDSETPASVGSSRRRRTRAPRP